VTTHPIQYNAPLFRLLASRGFVEVMVFYTWGGSVLANKYDPGFGKVITWDIPLLEGYDSQFLDNSARHPGSHHFRGIVNPDIIRRIDAFRPDAILVFGWSYSSHLMVLRHYKGKVPVFFRGDSTLLDDRRDLRALARNLFLGWVYRHIDKAFYVGTNNRAYYTKMGLSDGQLVKALHAVDNSFFCDADGAYQEKADQWRTELGISPGALVFLFAGKLERKKSPDLLIEVFEESAFPFEAHLILVGNGELESSLKSRATRETVHFLGFQNQRMMPVVYRLGDVFVLPSEGPKETWGLAINEAMASGRPVLASTKCGASIDLIRDGVNGFMFKAGDAADLSAKMLALARLQSHLKGMGENAFLHIQEFSVPAVAVAVEAAVMEVTP
jgi:glycosyltransferase involved in cell wall biosynthesis